MAKKKKKRNKAQKKESRIARARNWLPTYEGTKIVRVYRKKFGVDVTCAVRELQEIGYKFDPGYVENLLKSETARIEAMRRKKEEKLQEEEYNPDQDDTFFYIAGYTSGGAPYGVTWEQMGLEPYEDEFDDDEIITYNHYEFLNPKEKNFINSKLREDFSNYVEQYRRLPSRNKQKQLIEKVFENRPAGPIHYTKDFNVTYRKIIRKRENAFIREGVLPKRFTPTEIKKLFEQSVMLESEHLIFRKITENDFDDLAIMLRDPEVMIAWGNTFSDEQIHNWINNQILRYRDHIVGYFAVINKDTGEFIGQMGLLWNDIEELRALEIGYILKRKYWGMGFATEGAAALAEYAFTKFGLNRVYATIRPENKSSIHVAEKIGMKSVGSYFKQYNEGNLEHIIYAKDRDLNQE